MHLVHLVEGHFTKIEASASDHCIVTTGIVKTQWSIGRYSPNNIVLMEESVHGVFFVQLAAELKKNDSFMVCITLQHLPKIGIPTHIAHGYT